MKKFVDSDILGESEKNVGRFAGCDASFSHPIVVNQIFLCSHEPNLDHKPFPIDIGHLMHLLTNIFFVRPCMGVLQTGEIFSQAPLAF